MHIKNHCTGHIDEARLQFVVVCVKHNGQWLLVRHKDRATWEMAGGHIDEGERVLCAALRELYEETGILKMDLETICDYEVIDGSCSSFGRLFYTTVEELCELPGYEIAEVRLFDKFPPDSTYPDIYDILLSCIGAYENNRNGSLIDGVKTNIYFVRHARPDFSIKDDMTRPLTEKGMTDTRKVTRVLSDKNIEAIYSSPFKRAYDTVKDLADENSLEITIVEDFRERKVDDVWVEDFNDFSRKQWEDFNFKLECGECLKEVQERNVTALYYILKRNHGRNIAVGSHGTALSTIINYFNPDFGYDDFWSIVDKMPYILCFKFTDMKFTGMEEVKLCKT